MSEPVSNHRIYPHIRNGRYYNHATEKRPRFFFHTLMIMLKSHVERYFTSIDTAPWCQSCIIQERTQELTITWIGHATFLIQVNGINILTDPVFDNLSLLFPRITPPAVTLENLPPIDIVLISHNHRDHLDLQAFKTLRKHHALYLVPEGDAQWFSKRKYDKVIEHTWWNNTKYTRYKKPPLTCTFLPAHHWSQRGLFDYNKSLWGSWMLSIDNQTIYFGGDTAYSHHFSAIAEEFPRIDVACMPIGPCEPEAWMKYSHINPEEAVRGFLDLNAQTFLPMHWGTYHFGTDSFTMAYERLLSAWAKESLLTEKQLFALKVGQQYTSPIVTPTPARPTTILENPY